MSSTLEAARDTAAGLLAAVNPSKPIQLYAHTGGPNPYKCVIIFEELNLPYEIITLQFPEMKAEKFLAINPNGRVPAIVDPNTGMTVWESNACVQYLCDTYDRTGKISYKLGKEYYAQLQWSYFQASGQGPYFGQKVWFSVYHPEKIESAQERYAKEIDRVSGVVDLHLKREGSQFLVGDKCGLADFCMVPWNAMLSFVIGEKEEKELRTKYPAWAAWRDRVEGRPSVQKAMEIRTKSMSK